MTRSETLDAAEQRPEEVAENDIDASPSFLGKRARVMEASLPIGTPAMVKNGKRPQGGALATALAEDASVVQ